MFGAWMIEIRQEKKGRELIFNKIRKNQFTPQETFWDLNDDQLREEWEENLSLTR